MISLNTRYGRVISFILSVALLSGILSSCNKGPINVLYVLGVITENTAPQEVQDPEIRESYVSLLGDLDSDLADLMGSSPSTFPGTGVSHKKVAEVELNPQDLRAEDERRSAIYDNYLPRLKQIESSYKERIEHLEKRDGSSFRIEVHFLLVRGREDSDSVLLQEYPFELKYN